MNDTTPSPRTRRRLAHWFGATLCLIVLLSAAAWLFSPSLIASLAPRFADRLGLDNIALQVGRPGIDEISVRSLRVESSGLKLVASHGTLRYHWLGALRGDLESARFETVELTLRNADTSGSTTSSADIDTLFDSLPIQAMSAESLRLLLPDINFAADGRFSVSEDAVDIALLGQQPEIAAGIRFRAALAKSGVFSAQLNDTAAEGPRSQIAIRGTIAENTVNLSGDIDLNGYALTLVSSLLGLPAGTGNVKVSFSTALPWPVPGTLTPADIVASVPRAELNWQAADSDLAFTDARASLEIEPGAVAANVSGTVLGTINESNISATFPDAYPLQSRDGTITGGSGLILRVQRPELDIRSTLRHFSISKDTQTALSVESAIEATVNNVAASGQLGFELDIAGTDPLATTGRVRFDGDVSTAADSRKVNVDTSIDLIGDTVQAEGTLSTGVLDEVSFVAHYQRTTGAGRVRAEDTLNVARPVLASLIPGWAARYDLDSGQIDTTLNLEWASPELLAADLELSIADASGHYDDYLASGISTRLKLHSDDASDPDAWQLETSRASIASIDIGLPVTDIELDFSWFSGRVAVAAAQGEFLGGRAVASPFDYNTESGAADIRLALSDIELAEVLALEGEDIQGTGRLDGTLPVTLRDNNASVAEGRLKAQAPGGLIRLTPSFSGPTGQPGLDFALLALKDFNYTELSCDINYSENGDLQLGVRLQGRNPAIENGRSIIYNLNISENIPVLLESLRLQDQVTRKIEKQVGK